MQLFELSYSVAKFPTSAQQKHRIMYSPEFSLLMVWFEFYVLQLYIYILYTGEYKKEKEENNENPTDCEAKGKKRQTLSPPPILQVVSLFPKKKEKKRVRSVMFIMGTLKL